MPNLNIELPDALHKRLKLQAVEQGRPLKDVIAGKLEQHA